MDASKLVPGQEVVLLSGTRGVLYARTWCVTRRGLRQAEATWYFLPDSASASGLVVMSQPREVTESSIATAFGVRAGRWPSPGHRLSAAERQAAYVAHMAGRPLPELD